MAQDGRAVDLKRWALISLGAVVFAVQAKQARDVYVEEVSSGSKPIEAVGTAVAAFVGLVPGRDPKRWAPISLGVAVFAVRAKTARDVYVEEVSSGSKPIEGVGTAVAAFGGLLPGGPING
jgi:phage tail sheath protein FI